MRLRQPLAFPKQTRENPHQAETIKTTKEGLGGQRWKFTWKVHRPWGHPSANRARIGEIINQRKSISIYILTVVYTFPLLPKRVQS